uniref:Nuclear pore complex protein Nup88 n=1 Tax=Parascaris univalens TaxID=6257 RepID=A0A915BVK0_PARUN
MMGILLEEILSRSKKPLICGYVRQAVLIFADDVLHLLSDSSADVDGHAQFEGYTALNIRPKLPDNVDVQYIAANEIGSRVVLLSRYIAFSVEIPQDVWCNGLNAWDERIRPSYYCRCSAIGTASKFGSYRASILRARWYMKRHNEYGQNKSERIGLLYSDSVIRIFDTSEHSKCLIVKVDFRQVLYSDFSSTESEQSRLGLHNSIVSFDFGPPFGFTDTGDEEELMHTIFAVDSENGDLYVAPFQFCSPRCRKPSGPFHIEWQSRGESLCDVCDIIHVRHASSPTLALFALVTTTGIVVHFVPLILQKAFLDDAVDYEMLPIDSFQLPYVKSISDGLLLNNDDVDLGRYLVFGSESVYWVDVKPSIASIHTVLRESNSCIVDEGSVFEESSLQHIFCIVDSTLSSTQIRINCACTVMTKCQMTEIDEDDIDEKRVLFVALTSDNQLLTRRILIHHLYSNMKVLPLKSTTSPRECDAFGFLSLSAECVNVLRNRVTVPKVKLMSTVSEEELIATSGAIADALKTNLSVINDAHQLVASRLNDVHQSRKDLEEQWGKIDDGALRIVRAFLDVENRIYEMRDRIGNVRKRLDRIRSVLSQRVPFLTNAEKEALAKLEKMHSTLKGRIQYIGELADEVASRRRDRFGFVRPFRASINARLFVLSKNSDDIGQLEAWMGQLKNRLDRLQGTLDENSIARAV